MYGHVVRIPKGDHIKEDAMSSRKVQGTIYDFVHLDDVVKGPGIKKDEQPFGMV